MKIYYFSRRTLATSALALLLAISIFSWALIKFEHVSVAYDLPDPIFQGNSGQKAVAITVNVDWGEEYIPQMLKEFDTAGAKVTFFVTGKWAEKHPDLLKQMDKAGHSIQNHGYKHCHFNSLSAGEGSQEIKKAEDVIYKAIGKRSSYFASPYGEYNKNVIEAATGINYKLIMWSCDTIDWQKPSPETIVSRVMKKVHNDAIILMHPTDPTVKALPEILKQLKAENYKMVTLDKIIIEKPKKPEEGSNSHEN